MPSITKLPITITPTSGGKYQTFNRPNRIRYHDNNAATCHVGGKNATLNRPSTLTCTKFQTGIPTGAEVTQITVRLKHSKSQYNGKDCNVQAPTISLIDNNGKVLKSRKAQAPTNTPTENSVLFNFNVAYIHYNVINSNNFGVKVDYPANSNDNEGDINVYYIEIHVAYKLSKYSLKLNHISGAYNGDTYTMKLDVSNINQTTYDPTITLTAPTGFSFKGSHLENGAENSGYNCTVVNPTTLSILVGFGKNRSNRTIILEFEANFTYGTGIEYLDKTFNVTESVNQWTASKTVRITKTRPADPTTDPDPTPATPTSDSTQTTTTPVYIDVYRNEEFDIEITMPTDAYEGLETTDTALQFGLQYPCFTFKVGEVTGRIFTVGDVDGQTSFTVKATPLYNGRWNLLTLQRTSEGELEDCQYFTFNVKPRESALTLPAFTILSLSKEECNRLGTGYNYTAQTFLKVFSDYVGETYVYDWYKNCRIGVFNNAIPSNVASFTYIDEETGETKVISYDGTDYDSLTAKEIFDNAEYWSPCPLNLNEYTNLECPFVYNENYPLYILIVGDYYESPITAPISYTEPVIVETETYNGRETNGTYPTPILNTINNDDSSEMNITPLNNASTLITYELPLDEDYGTNNEIAIRGLEITGTIESNTDNLILYTTLKNSKNESRQRSLILDQTQTTLTDTNTFTIGGIGDLWGFTTLDIENLEDWETHLPISNSLMDTTGQINYKNLQLIIYIEHIEGQNVRTYINGEDLSYYGVFLTDLKIPEGLKTDTDYINVNGTDVNDPFRQNIKEKTIEIDFEIGDNCDLEGSTNSLRALTKLLVNERDQYNRPIPKRLEFSHYPDVFWEYILEDTLTTDLDINTYTVKAKLVVPAGTSYDKVATKTNTVGYINGLAHIRPVIQFKPNSQHISLKETITEQEFQMSYPLDEWTGKVVEVDCDNRIVLLKDDEDDTTGTDITAYVDFNSDWFTILGEYDFNSDGCAIISVAYQERW